MILLIDGNFFAQRIRNAVGLDFINNPEKDTDTFIYECTQSLSSEIRNLKNTVKQIVICRDYSSWRKDVEQVYPLITDIKEQDYKANRDGEKDYDVQAFYKAYDDWMNLLEEKANIVIVQTYKAEADDGVFILSKELTNKGFSVLNWSSDGDYVQNVDENVALLKFPQRHLYLNKYNSENQKRQAGDIFGLNKSNVMKDVVNLFTEDNIKYVNPMETLFVKVISGDKKDNVPPIFMWESSTGTRLFRPSARVFKKAFPLTLYKGKAIESSEIQEEHLYSEEYMKSLIRNLVIEAKQIPGLDYKLKKKEFTPALELALESKELTEYVDHAYTVFVSNLKMKHLSHKQIPEFIVKGVTEEYYKNSKNQEIDKIAVFESMCNMMEIQAPSNNSYFNQFDLAASEADNILNNMFG